MTPAEIEPIFGKSRDNWNDPLMGLIKRPGKFQIHFRRAHQNPILG